MAGHLRYGGGSRHCLRHGGA
ncbi:hypothetical protein LINGRAHAP2_LOCUS18706 [Linum grandiflorum]